MTVKSKDVIGLTVITIHDGKTVGKVRDIIYDPSVQKVKALQVNTGGFFSDIRILPTQEIKSIGKDAVIIDTEESLRKPADAEPSVADIARHEHYLTQTRIITEKGVDIGSVNDIYFNDSGDVKEIEVSDNKRIKIKDIITIGQDVTIVRDQNEDDFESYQTPPPMPQQHFQVSGFAGGESSQNTEKDST